MSRKKAEAFATDEHGNKQKQRHGRKNKQKHLPRINTEFHGKDISRDMERRHCIQSRMRERRYKYTIWKGPLRQAQGPGFRTASEPASLKAAEPVELADKLRDRGSSPVWSVSCQR